MDHLQGRGFDAEGHRKAAPGLAVQLHGNLGTGRFGPELLGGEGAHGAIQGLLRQDAGEDIWPENLAYAVYQDHFELPVGQGGGFGTPEVAAVVVAVGDDGELGYVGGVVVDDVK